MPTREAQAIALALAIAHAAGFAGSPLPARVIPPRCSTLLTRMSMESPIRDCLVVGAGISGSTLAHNLHRSGVDVLLATSDHFGHGLFAMVQRVLNQIHLALEHGLEPAVFLGERTFMCATSLGPSAHQPCNPSRP